MLIATVLVLILIATSECPYLHLIANLGASMKVLLVLIIMK